MKYCKTMFRSLIVSLMVFFLTLIISSEAGSFTLQKTQKNNYQRWFTKTPSYYINVNGTPDDSGEIDAIRDAFQAWEDVSSAGISFKYKGDTNIAQATPNFANVIFWIEQGWPADLGPQVVAHTKVWTNFLDNIVDADIFFNGENYHWSTSGNPNALDIQHVATHEIGHFIGIDHSDIAAATMDPKMRLNDTEKRTLEQDDMDAVSFLYPMEPVEIEIASGNNQKGEIGIPLPEPLVVRVTDTKGDPVPDSIVIFDITQGTGIIGNTAPVRTDEFGLTQNTMTPGSDEVIEVRATGAGLQELTFVVDKEGSSLPHMPVAEAGDDQSVVDVDEDGSELVTLDGSRSSDPNGTIVSYSWLKNGLEIAAAGVSPSISFPVGTHTVALEVTDDDGEMASDTVLITVKESEKQPPIEGLIGYWPFEEGSGKIAKDASGFGNDAAVFGADWAEGKFGGTLVFDGKKDYVEISDSPSLDFTDQVTLSCWIYPTNLSGGWHTIMQKSRADLSWYDWQFYARAQDAATTNGPSFRIDQNGDQVVGANEEVVGDIVLSTRNYYFIAATYDGTNMKLYIDGTLKNTTSIAGVTIPDSDGNIWIGGNEIWGEYFQGLIDEVRIYNRALSEEEIQQLAGVESPNRSPVASAGTASTDEDVSVSGMLSASDPDGDSLTYSIVSGTTKGMVTLLDAATGDFTYTPEENANGSDSFAFKVNDGQADSKTATFSITINPVNDAPVISGTPLTSINEGVLYSFTPDVGDVDGDALTFSVANKPSWASFDSSTGTLTGTPTNNDVGTTTETVITVSDGNLFAPLSPFDLTVNNVNDVPEATDGFVFTDEDIAVSGTLSASDVDGDTLSFIIVSGAAQGTVTLVDATSGELTYSPNDNTSGSDSFTFKVNDGTADSNTATITVTINPINDAPVITSSPPATATEDVVYSYYPKVNDVDGTDTLSWTLISAPHGMIVDTATGAIFWNPEEGALNSGLVSLMVDDGSGGTDSQEFTIVVTPVNDAPTISGTPIVSVTTGDFYSFTPDAEDAEADALTFSIANEPSWASFDLSTGSLTGTPGNEDVGTTTGIVITVSDGELSSSLPSFDLTAAQLDLEEGLIAYWPFEEGSGTVIQDYSGSGNDGNVFGADWTEGKIGGALVFDGVDDHVRIPDSPTLSLDSNRVTFTFWMKAKDLSSDWSTILHRTTAKNNWFDWQLYARAVDARTANHPVFRVNWNGNHSTQTDEEVEGDIVLSPNTWYFIVCTYDGLQMKYYMDATLRGAVAIEDGAIPNGGMDIWIGGNTPWGEFFDGIIDEVRIYNRALGEDEIQLLYEQASTN